MLEALKVKIKSHQAEARIIRKSERSALRMSTYLHIRARLHAADLPERAIARIMARAKARGVSVPRLKEGKPVDPLSERLDVSSVPGFIADHTRLYNRLRAHRVCEPVATGAKWPNGKMVMRDNSLRSETRHALLAYGFLRGRGFKAMEHKSYVPPDFARVESIARRFADGAGLTADQVFAQRFAEWRAMAGEWTHPDLAATPVAADHD